MHGHIGATINRATFIFAQRVLTHLGKIIDIAVVSCLMRVDFKMRAYALKPHVDPSVGPSVVVGLGIGPAAQSLCQAVDF